MTHQDVDFDPRWSERGKRRFRVCPDRTDSDFMGYDVEEGDRVEGEFRGQNIAIEVTGTGDTWKRDGETWQYVYGEVDWEPFVREQTELVGGPSEVTDEQREQIKDALEGMENYGAELTDGEASDVLECLDSLR